MNMTVKVTRISLSTANVIRYNRLLSKQFELSNRVDNGVNDLKKLHKKLAAMKKELWNLNKRVRTAQHRMEKEMIQNKLLTSINHDTV